MSQSMLQFVHTYGLAVQKAPQKSEQSLMLEKTMSTALHKSAKKTLLGAMDPFQ